jgi:hypothetical protein
VRHPGTLEILDGVAIDLGQRRIARVVPVTTNGEPFSVAGLRRSALLR